MTKTQKNLMDGKITMGRLDKKLTFVVTGGLGFIGSHFVDKVLAAGHRVINYDKETYAAHTELEFKGDYEYIKADIAEIKSIPYCDVIVNFAAESHVDNSIEDSFCFVKSNILGVYNILELLKNKKIDSFVSAWEYNYPIFLQISTDEVFGDIEEGFFEEEAVHTPSNPYSATKSAAEQLVVSWGRTFDIPFLISRTTNNYGPRQNSEKLIPRAITDILKGAKVPIHGGGSYVRNWIHVEDNVDAILKIIDSGTINEYYHIASDEEYSVKQIVEMICEKMGVEYDKVTDPSMDRSGADVRYALNYDKLKALGWKQNKHLKSSIEETIKYYKNEREK
jgi:dTDP-glucose 4,6-dehydratase